VVAGIADSIGFLTRGGVFAANMTGNTVLAGIALAQGRTGDAADIALAVGSFFVGCMAAHLLLELWHKRAVPILLEAAIVAALGFLPIQIETAVVVLAFAMGLQASAITSFGGVSISTVVVTSTLARTAEAGVDAMLRSPSLPSVTRPWLLAASWAGYLAGAIAGALLVKVVAYPLLVAAALLLLVAALCAFTSAD
jgi:uncharacterized membrane protein YoaK (UPF0700 family)